MGSRPGNADRHINEDKASGLSQRSSAELHLLVYNLILKHLRHFIAVAVSLSDLFALPHQHKRKAEGFIGFHSIDP